MRKMRERDEEERNLKINKTKNMIKFKKSIQ
jgi:hypothetical protein